MQETEKRCVQNEKGLYDDKEATCSVDNDEKSPALNDFKHAGMIKL